MEKQQSFQAAELSAVGPAHLGKGKEALLLDSNCHHHNMDRDEDCHCGVEECKRKLKIKPNILKRSFSDAASSDAALKLATNRVVAASIEEKVYLQNMDFGVVQRFDSVTKKHLIMFGNGGREYIDMSKEGFGSFVTLNLILILILINQVLAVGRKIYMIQPQISRYAACSYNALACPFIGLR
ncbi:hypothetical protein P3S68_001344 [Capsicum galapagoense]